MPSRRPLKKSAMLTRYLRKKARGKLRKGKHALSQLSQINELRDEIELLTSYSTDVIYRLRYDTMQYDYISPSIIRLLGYTPDELKTLNLRNLILETRIVGEGLKPVESFLPLEENRKRGEVNKWQADYLMRTKDGKTLWVSDVSYPWFNKEGAIIGSVGSLRDISDRVEADERVREELLRLANTDSLTGLSTRRVYFSRLEDELKRMRRSRADLSILLIDVDHFKKINDRHGHGAGDTVLQGLVKVIMTCLRETDLAARLGGEEFGIILPDTPVEGAYWVAERMRSAIAKESYMVSEPPYPVGCTVSIGVAAARFSDETMDATRLYKAADTRLYIAKNTGRNQVSVDELVHMH